MIFPVLLILILAQSFDSALARTKPRRAAFDRDYASALATADRFLQAWQTQDAESGLLLLTDHVRQHTDESRLHGFFSSEGSLGPSFEIGRGIKVSATRYKFPVALFSGDSAHPRHRAHPQAAALIVVRVGRDQWAIDKLP
jgi:hypothetical protein